MIKTYSVFVRTNADGNHQDDMNVVAQHHKTYAGIVRGDSMERAVVNAVQKTGKPAPFLLIYEGEVAVGENAAHCPCCGENLMNLSDGGKTGMSLDGRIRSLGISPDKHGVPNYICPHCKGTFTGKIETVTRTMFFQVHGE